MNELHLYQTCKDIARAMAHEKDFNRINCFAIGYDDVLRTGNLKAEVTNSYFFSRKWEELGSDPDEMVRDFPLCLMYPPRRYSEDLRWKTFEAMFLFLDLYQQDRNGDTETEYARRTKEQIWFDCEQIKDQFFCQLIKKGFQIGRITSEPLVEYEDQRYYGIAARASIKIKTPHLGEAEFIY